MYEQKGIKRKKWKINYLHKKIKNISTQDITTNRLDINNDAIISKNETNFEKLYTKIKIIGITNFGEIWLVKNKHLKKEFQWN